MTVSLDGDSALCGSKHRNSRSCDSHVTVMWQSSDTNVWAQRICHSPGVHCLVTQSTNPGRPGSCTVSL